MEKKIRKTKTDAILKHLRRYGSITDPVARSKYHTNRLSSIILNLRNQGHEIDTVMCNGKDEYGTYRYGKYIYIKEA
jgi:hypothetical protein